VTAAEELIRERIRERGPLSFAEFMGLALYHPAVGYYARRNPLGARGDYYTSPEVHPGFAALIGRQVEELWETLGRPLPLVVHEAGPGSGLFARDLLDWLRGWRPELYGAVEYRLDEQSAALRAEQARRLAAAGHLARVGWVEGLQADGAANFVFANELLDALPVHLVRVRGGRLEELFVGAAGARLGFEAGEAAADVRGYFERLGRLPGEGCLAEVNLAAADWMGSVGAALGRGLLLVLDYGYPAERLYAPDRRFGTLLCYARHTLNSDPLRRVGEQDITSHVDFTSVARAGEAAGLRTLGLASQRQLLGNLGWEGLRRGLLRAATGQAERDANLRGLDALVDPAGLGRVMALVQQRGLEGLRPLGLAGGAPSGWRGPAPVPGPEHLLLPGPAEAEGLGDFEAAWAEAFGGAEEA
jgi:SAM-dependent MidA family methyltransferase